MLSDSVRRGSGMTATSRAFAGGRERGAPLGAQATPVDTRFAPSTEWGCSRTGPARHAMLDTTVSGENRTLQE
jgi:hypothetical protein